MRRTFIEVVYDGQDISADLAPYLIAFTYTDEDHGKQDSISIGLQDREGYWRDAWFPEIGTTISARIRTETDGETSVLDCGIFEVDEVEVRAAPWTVNLKAVVVPTKSPLRRMKKTRSWQNITLKAVLEELAGEAGLEPFYDSPENQLIKRLDQRGETDAQFLTRLAKENGLCFKATAGKLILYDLMDYESKDAAFSVSALGGTLTSLSIRAKSDAVYDTCTVSYWDRDKQKTLTYTYDPGGRNKKEGGSAVKDDGGVYE